MYMCNDSQVQSLKPVLHVDVWNEEKRFLGKVCLLLKSGSLLSYHKVKQCVVMSVTCDYSVNDSTTHRSNGPLLQLLNLWRLAASNNCYCPVMYEDDTKYVML